MTETEETLLFQLLGSQREVLATALGARADVCGLFVGLRQRGGDLLDEPTLSVHVTQKLPPESLPSDRRLPSTLGELPGIPAELAHVALDVVAQGEPKLYRFDHTDRVQPRLNMWRGHSTITLLFRAHGKTYGIVSGHGMLPLQNGRFVDPLTHSVPVVAEDAAEYEGREPPLRLRLDDPKPGEELHHWSRLGERGECSGRVAGVALTPIELAAGHGEKISYAVVVNVASRNRREPFSLPGDSGSLVVDSERRVVGTVVGGTPEHNVSYVLPLFQGPTKELIGEANYVAAFGP